VWASDDALEAAVGVLVVAIIILIEKVLSENPTPLGAQHRSGIPDCESHYPPFCWEDNSGNFVNSRGFSPPGTGLSGFRKDSGEKRRRIRFHVVFHVKTAFHTGFSSVSSRFGEIT